MSRLLGALSRHWFEPGSLRDLAIARIIIVAGQLFLFLPSLERQLWHLTVDESLYQPRNALKVLLLPFAEWGARPDPLFLQAVWLAAVVTGVLALIGLFTRPSLFLFAAANTLMVAHDYSYGALHHPSAVLIIALWVLACGPSGSALSVDDFRRRMYSSVRFMTFRPRSPQEERSEFARWPLRTIQWVFVLIYLSAALSKLLHGFDWLNGYTLGYYLLQDGMRWDQPLGVFLHDKTVLLVLASVVTLVFELTFAVAVLVPRLTPIYLLVGAGMHISILVLMRAPFLQYLVVYSVFGDQLRQSVPERLRRPAPAPWTVIYDGSCELCIRSMVFVDYLDLRRRLRFVDMEQGLPESGIEPGSARHAMLIVSPDGRSVAGGFDAFRQIARLLPPLWPLRPVLHTSLAARLGPAIYARVAARRCSAGRCSGQRQQAALPDHAESVHV
jgi:predicted DCC family thiol-disulfide oxidoreductase YuxK/uncharacterized membrane protein YphA (DoxX/SURF4 family)